MNSSWPPFMVWVGIFVWHLYLALVRLGIVRPLVKAKFKIGGTMQLSKPFDPAPIIAALKTAGIQDAEKLVNDSLPVIFDWLNSSVALESQTIPLLAVATPILNTLEQKALDAVKAVETKIGA